MIYETFLPFFKRFTFAMNRIEWKKKEIFVLKFKVNFPYMYFHRIEGIEFICDRPRTNFPFHPVHTQTHTRTRARLTDVYSRALLSCRRNIVINVAGSSEPRCERCFKYLRAPLLGRNSPRRGWMHSDGSAFAVRGYGIIVRREIRLRSFPRIKRRPDYRGPTIVQRRKEPRVIATHRFLKPSTNWSSRSPKKFVRLFVCSALLARRRETTDSYCQWPDLEGFDLCSRLWFRLGR